MDGRTTEMASAPYYKLPPLFEEEAKKEGIIIHRVNGQKGGLRKYLRCFEGEGQTITNI